MLTPFNKTGYRDIHMDGFASLLSTELPRSKEFLIKLHIKTQMHGYEKDIQKDYCGL
jgi:hypothetical protein